MFHKRCRNGDYKTADGRITHDDLPRRRLPPISTIDAYDGNKGPIEFQTTYRLVILYAQPAKNQVKEKRDDFEGVRKVFPECPKAIVFLFTYSKDRNVVAVAAGGSVHTANRVSYVLLRKQCLE